MLQAARVTDPALLTCFRPAWRLLSLVELRGSVICGHFLPGAIPVAGRRGIARAINAVMH